MMSIKQFVKDWTLPVAIAVGTIVYLTFYFVPQLDTAGETLGAVVDTIFPMMVFCTLFSTFCRIDFHQMKPHRWHAVSLVYEHNGVLYRKDGSKRLADNTLVALTLMIAESRTEEKDVMVKVVVNLINQQNE